MMNSRCGFFCGYMVDKKSSIFNPIDEILVLSSSYFPLDYIFFLIMTLFIFISTIYGVIKLGFSLYFFKGY